jgi:uncharacterized membrane protein (DUF2068 family)
LVPAVVLVEVAMVVLAELQREQMVRAPQQIMALVAVRVKVEQLEQARIIQQALEHSLVVVTHLQMVLAAAAVMDIMEEVEAWRLALISEAEEVAEDHL